VTIFGGWTSWVSRRFLTGRRGGRGRLIFLFSVTLIGAGVATLNTILAVMNGLQQGYIRSILEIGSYHLRWSPESSGDDGIPDEEDLLRMFRDDRRVRIAVPFRDGQTMLNGERPRPAGALIRGVPESLYVDDAALAERLDIVDGSFDVSDRGIVLGDELAITLGVGPGDRITALDLGEAGLSPGEVELEVTGLFRCGYRDYEASLAFVSLDSFAGLFGPGRADIGMKLRNVDQDRGVLEDLAPSLEGSGGRLRSWRDENRSFFGALRTEKVMMLLLLTLIFVVVAVNIDHSLRRMATERTEDLAILKAVGASPRGIRGVFLRHGLFIGGIGGAAGSLLGVAVGANVDAILTTVRRLTTPSRFGGGGMEAFFRNSEVMACDVAIIFGLALALSSLAAVRAAAMAARLKPAEVLRSE